MVAFNECKIALLQTEYKLLICCSSGIQSTHLVYFLTICKLTKKNTIKHCTLMANNNDYR